VLAHNYLLNDSWRCVKHALRRPAAGPSHPDVTSRSRTESITLPPRFRCFCFLRSTAAVQCGAIVNGRSLNTCRQLHLTAPPPKHPLRFPEKRAAPLPLRWRGRSLPPPFLPREVGVPRNSSSSVPPFAGHVTTPTPPSGVLATSELLPKDPTP